MASKPAQKRLSKEFVAMQKSPPPFVWAAPEEKNILTWNFIIRGPVDSPYHGGEYHGQIMFPSDYPFKPPGIKMLTPSGRFAPDKKICFSMSDFHPGTWNPAWSVATICTGILSFMLSDEITTGSVTSTDQDKRILAARSHAWNVQQKKFQEAFPEYAEPAMTDLPNMGETDRGQASTATSTSTSTTSLSTAAPTPTSPTATATTSNIVRAQEVAPVLAPRLPNANPGLLESWTVGFRNRWAYAALIVLAVLVSRVST